MLDLRQLCAILIVLSSTCGQETNSTDGHQTSTPTGITSTDSLVNDSILSTTIASELISSTPLDTSNATGAQTQGGGVVASTSQAPTTATPTLLETSPIGSSSGAGSLKSSTTELPDRIERTAGIFNATQQFNESRNISPLELIEDRNNVDESDDKDSRNSASANKPETCAGGALLPEQPVYTAEAVLKKCCPIGESIYYGEAGQTEYCDSSDASFNPAIVDVTLYDDCIEDNERNVELETEVGNPCNISIIYSRQTDDALFVLQNGSLLIMDKYGNDSFSIENDYCLDVDYKTGHIFAVVCEAPINSHLERGQTILFAIFMLASIPCLMLVSFFHFAIRRLRTMHGLCLGFMSSCLAMGFLLHSIAQLSDSYKSKVGYAVQYFMLSYFMWLLVLCCNIVIIVWYYLPRYIRLSRTARYVHFVTYSAFALSIPLCIVFITRSKGLAGMPSYFYQAWSESIQSSQRYFIPPVTTILVVCFVILIVAYFGFRQLDKIVETRSLIRYTALNRSGKDNTGLPVIDRAMLEETKQDAKCITYLAIIVLTTWIMEVITFYSPGPNDYLACMEIINGLQGVFILIFFIGVRHRRNIIVSWWKDRGSFGITEVEMQNLKRTDQDN